MINAYNVLKFVHVLSVIAWVGGVTALTILTRRMARERSREALAALLRQATSYGQMIVGPASGIVLLSGAAMVGMAHLGFGSLWVVWGFTGIVLHFLVGAILIRKRTMELAQIASANAGDDTALLEASGRLWAVQLIYLTIMASVVAVMVIKPTF